MNPPHVDAKAALEQARAICARSRKQGGVVMPIAAEAAMLVFAVEHLEAELAAERARMDELVTAATRLAANAWDESARNAIMAIYVARREHKD